MFIYRKGIKKQNRTSIPNTEIYDSQIMNPTKLQKFSLQNTPKNKQMKIFPRWREKWSFEEKGQTLSLIFNFFYQKKSWIKNINMLAIQFLYLNVISIYLIIFHAPRRQSIWNICPIKEFQIFHLSVTVILTSYTKN
jgi:hypothetical protein